MAITIDTSKCKGCGACVAVCPEEALELVKGRSVLIEDNTCIECGTCITVCQPEALSL
jgi:ferredoxin